MAVLLWAVVRARSVVAPFVVGFLLAYLLDPLVDRLEGRGFSRWVAIWTVFMLFLLLFALMGFFIVPPLVAEARELAVFMKAQLDKLPSAIEEMGRWLSKLKLPGYLRRAVEDAASKTAQFVPSLLGRLAVALMRGLPLLGWAVLVPIVTYYFLKEIDPLREAVWRACPEDYRPELRRAVGEVSSIVGRYLRGLAIMCAVNFGLTWAALSVLRLKYALVVAIVTGLTYAIPYIGAVVSTILALSVAALTKSYASVGMNVWLYLGLVLFAMVAVNQICDLLINPRVMGRQVGLHPLTVLFSVLVGAQLFGILGALLAVPVVASLKAVVVTLYPALKAALVRRRTRGR